MRIITFFISIVIVYLLVSLFGALGAAIGLIIGQTIFMLLLHLITQTHNGGISSIFTDNFEVNSESSLNILPYIT